MKNTLHAIILGVVSAIAVAGIIALVATGHGAPEPLVAVAVLGLGALAGIAVPTGLVTDAASSLDTIVQAATTAAQNALTGLLDHDTTAAPAAAPAAQNAAQDAPKSTETAEPAAAGTTTPAPTAVTPGMSAAEATIAAAGR